MAVAIAQQRRMGVSLAKANKLEFNVVEVSDSMGWESVPVKRELKMLQWSFGECLLGCIYELIQIWSSTIYCIFFRPNFECVRCS